MTERRSKRPRLLDESDASSDSDSDANSSSASSSPGDKFKVNEDYARRFEHNKKREELHRLQDKYGQKHSSKTQDAGSDSASESSSSEEDEGELATAEVDEEIANVLQALKNKDPKLYDQNHKWFKEYDPSTSTSATTAKSKDKPVHLQDYHRANLLNIANGNGSTLETEQEEDPIPTYNEEQATLKQNLIDQAADNSDSESGDDLLVRKPGQKPEPSQQQPQTSLEDADTNPDKFLLDYVTSRAWATADKPYGALDEDDSEEDDQADAFEAAYNMRFEDPNKSNETLTSHSRKATLKQSARREEPNKRQRARQRDQERRDAEKDEERVEKARLRQLKLEEAQRKLDQFKKVAGIKGRGIEEDEWRKFLKADFDDANWEQEMSKRFDEEYYAEKEQNESADEDEQAGSKKKKKSKKPKFDDDIEIDDLIPDFEAREGDDGGFTLTDEEDVNGPDDANGTAALEDAEDDNIDNDDNPPSATAPTRKSQKDHTLDRRAAKRESRKQRLKLEELVDQQLSTDLPPSMSASSRKTPTAVFRYRETSPTAFGMSAHDILMADDKQLNEFVGLKKLAAFRDEARKAQDRKRLKKYRLSEWRKETFGDKEGPRISFGEYLNEVGGRAAGGYGDGDGGDGPEIDFVRGRGDEGGSKKRRRANKRKIKEAGIV